MKLAAFIFVAALAATAAFAQTYSVRIDRVSCDAETYESVLKDPSALGVLLEKGATNVSFLIVEPDKDYIDENLRMMPVLTASTIQYREVGSNIALRIAKIDNVLTADLSIQESLFVDGFEQKIVRKRTYKGAIPVTIGEPVLFNGSTPRASDSAEIYVITVAEKN